MVEEGTELLGQASLKITIIKILGLSVFILTGKYDNWWWI